MNKHTPGPWIVGELDGAPLIYCPSQRADVAYIAPNTTCPITDNPVITKHHDHNARLIAAAPDLLEALRAYDSWNYEVQSARVNGESIYSFAELCELRERAVAMGYAAINKATGAA